MKQILRRLGLAVGAVLLVVAAMKFEQRTSGTSGFQPVPTSRGTIDAIAIIDNELKPRSSSEPWYWLCAGVFVIAVSAVPAASSPRREVAQG